MFRLLRKKKVMRLIVGFVALSFLGGFIGSYAVRSLGQIDEPIAFRVKEQLLVALVGGEVKVLDR